MIWFVFFTPLAFAQPSGDPNDTFCFDLPDTQEVARCLQDRQFLRQLIEVQNQRIANLEKENDLLKREIELKDKIIEIDQREIKSTRAALDDMKEVTDRALRLAETGKPRSNWEIYGLLGIAMFVVGVLVGI